MRTGRTMAQPSGPPSPELLTKMFTHRPGLSGPRRQAPTTPPPPRTSELWGGRELGATTSVYQPHPVSRPRWRTPLARTPFGLCVCPPSQLWASGRARIPLGKGSLAPPCGGDAVGVGGRDDAAAGCPGPRPSEEADGAARFLTFCTEFSFVITPVFTYHLTSRGSDF